MKFNQNRKTTDSLGGNYPSSIKIGTQICWGGAYTNQDPTLCVTKQETSKTCILPSYVLIFSCRLGRHVTKSSQSNVIQSYTRDLTLLSSFLGLTNLILPSRRHLGPRICRIFHHASSLFIMCQYSSSCFIMFIIFIIFEHVLSFFILLHDLSIIVIIVHNFPSFTSIYHHSRNFHHVS